MQKAQRYISDELTHFIGKNIDSDKDQYNLLVDILNSGWLTHAPHEQTEKDSGGLTLSRHSQLSENLMYSPEIICFCDIPIEDLGLHISKYSRFGIGFNKSFLIEKGVNPVFYISKDSKIKYWPDADKPNDILKLYRSEFYDDMIDNYHGFVKDIMIYFKDLFYHSSDVIGSKAEQNKIRKFQDQVMKLEYFLDFHIFSYLKFFDNSKSEGDHDNYYMEREWRMIGNLQFNISNVRRVFLPESYAEMFRKDVPAYYGQLNFV